MVFLKAVIFSAIMTDTAIPSDASLSSICGNNGIDSLSLVLKQESVTDKSDVVSNVISYQLFSQSDSEFLDRFDSKVSEAPTKNEAICYHKVKQEPEYCNIFCILAVHDSILSTGHFCQPCPCVGYNLLQLLGIGRCGRYHPCVSARHFAFCRVIIGGNNTDGLVVLPHGNRKIFVLACLTLSSLLEPLFCSLLELRKKAFAVCSQVPQLYKPFCRSPRRPTPEKKLSKYTWLWVL